MVFRYFECSDFSNFYGNLQTLHDIRVASLVLQAQTEASWAHIASTVRRDRARDKSQTKEFFDSFRPGREMLSVKVYDRKVSKLFFKRLSHN